MSFIDLMKNDIWSDSDISARTESLVRSQFSASEEFILNRKFSGQIAGMYELTGEEQAQLVNFQIISSLAQAEGVAARADTELLLSTIKVEAAQKRLAQYSLELGKPEVTKEVLDDFGMPVLDEEGSPIVEIVEPEILPITEFLEDETTPNPDWSLVSKDNEERASAQVIVDVATVEVMELIDKRSSTWQP